MLSTYQISMAKMFFNYFWPRLDCG